jgi:transcriptional regulator with XRE-family HTH domain
MKWKANVPGTALVVLRTLRSWSQAELAKASGINQTKISGFERGRREPERETVVRLVHAMGFDMELFDYAEVVVCLVTSSKRRGKAGQRSDASASPEVSRPTARARKA